MTPNPKYLAQENDGWQFEDNEWTPSGQSQSSINFNEEAAINHSTSEPMQGIVETLINFFEDR